MGLLALERRDVSRAVPHLHEALALARNVGDQAREGDILGLFGLAALVTRQVDLARQCQEQALALARAVGDASAEKLTLERLSAISALTGDLSGAIDLLADSLALARSLGDRLHEADLLWHVAVRYAESGRREEALASGQAAVDLFARLGNPQAQVYREHLLRFQQGTEEPCGMAPDGSVSVTVLTTLPTADRASAGSGFRRGKRAVDYLRMAVSAGAISPFRPKTEEIYVFWVAIAV